MTGRHRVQDSWSPSGLSSTAFVGRCWVFSQFFQSSMMPCQNVYLGFRQTVWLSFLFAEKYPVPSSSLSFSGWGFCFTPKEHFLCSFALLRQDDCSFLSRVSVRASGFWGEVESGIFLFIQPKGFLFCHKQTAFRGTLLGPLPFSGPDLEVFLRDALDPIFQWELFSFNSCFPQLLSSSYRLLEYPL